MCVLVSGCILCWASVLCWDGDMIWGIGEVRCAKFIPQLNKRMLCVVCVVLSERIFLTSRSSSDSYLSCVQLCSRQRYIGLQCVPSSSSVKLCNNCTISIVICTNNKEKTIFWLCWLDIIHVPFSYFVCKGIHWNPIIWIHWHSLMTDCGDELSASSGKLCQQRKQTLTNILSNYSNSSWTVNTSPFNNCTVFPASGFMWPVRVP